MTVRKDGVCQKLTSYPHDIGGAVVQSVLAQCPSKFLANEQKHDAAIARDDDKVERKRRDDQKNNGAVVAIT